MTLLKINRLLPIYISIVPLKFEVDIQSQSKVRVMEPKKSNMAARRPFWKWHRWKSIGFCLWPPSTCIWNLKLKFQSKLDLCSGNHVVYRQMDRRTNGRTDKVNPVYPPSNFVGRGYKYRQIFINDIIPCHWNNPGAHFTNDFPSYFKFYGNLVLVWFHCKVSYRNKILHMSQQQSCCVMCKIS